MKCLIIKIQLPLFIINSFSININRRNNTCIKAVINCTYKSCNIMLHQVFRLRISRTEFLWKNKNANDDTVESDYMITSDFFFSSHFFAISFRSTHTHNFFPLCEKKHKVNRSDRTHNFKGNSNV